MIGAIAALLALGSCGALAKKNVKSLGRQRAIVYFYLVLVSLLAAGTLILGVDVSLPGELLADYAALVVIGAIAVIAYFKAMEKGMISVLAPLGKVHVLIVMGFSIAFFGEVLSIMQIAGSMIIIASAAVIALDRGIRIEKGVNYMLIAILGWGYYFTFLKTFVTALGPYAATVVSETGVASLVILYYIAKRSRLSLPSAEHSPYVLAHGSLLFIGILLYNYSISIIGAALTASVVAAAPIINSLASYFLLGEKLDNHKYLAIALMVLGLILLL